MIKNVLTTKLLPVFPAPVAHCNALNASPYVVTLPEFTHCFGTDPVRCRIIESLKGVFARVRRLGVVPFAVMVGGSFIRFDSYGPKDLDGVIFYRCDRGPDVAAELLGLRSECLKLGLDVRFVPGDVDPVALIRVASFFTSLYTAVKAPHILPQGVVLIHGLTEPES